MKVKAGSFILMDNCWLFTSCFCPKETCLQWSLLKAAASSLWPLLSTGPSFNSNVTMKVSIEAQNGGPIATIIDMFNCTTSVVPRPLPGFILQPWRKIGGRFDFSPWVRDTIWEWPGRTRRPSVPPNTMCRVQLLFYQSLSHCGWRPNLVQTACSL